MTDQQIDKVQAAVLVENAHELWILARIFALTHEDRRRRKKYWFTQLARATLIASMVTVVLSAFGFSQVAGVSDGSRPDVAVNTPRDSPSSNEPEPQPNRVIWFLTALCAALAAGAKLGEQHIGRPEDIQAHSNAELLLAGKMDSLKLLVARIIGYHDGTQSYEFQELSDQYDVLAVQIGEAGKLVGVTPDRAKEPAAQEAIEGNAIDIALSRVKTPEELPDSAPGIEAAVRGGSA